MVNSILDFITLLILKVVEFTTNGLFFFNILPIIISFSQVIIGTTIIRILWSSKKMMIKIQQKIQNLNNQNYMMIIVILILTSPRTMLINLHQKIRNRQHVECLLLFWFSIFDNCILCDTFHSSQKGNICLAFCYWKFNLWQVYCLEYYLTQDLVQVWLGSFEVETKISDCIPLMWSVQQLLPITTQYL